jgi:hypothetical protein
MLKGDSSPMVVLDVTCRVDGMAAMKSLERRHGPRAFKRDEIVQEVQALGTTYRESTIRTHVTSKMCGNAPDHHSGVYNDLERVSHGHHRMRVP